MCTDIEALVKLLGETRNSYDIDKIRHAYEFARDLHEGQYRVSGEPYIMHPLAVAEIVASLGLDTDSICAALLHDTVEDCGITVQNISSEFGTEVGMLVDGLTKLVQIPFEDKEEEQMENLRKMFLAMSKDVRVIFIKLCDRLHNMRTLSAKKDDKRRKTALETMQVYAPLAHRLGMQRIKQELENLALSYLDPIGYAQVKGSIEKKYGQNRNFVSSIKEQITSKLTEQGFNFQLDGRVKSVYSIYRKMFNQNKSLDEIYDFYAVRIITQTELECYTVLGIIHDTFRSIPGRFKDYISTPKPNMYQSLHTTVIGREGIPFEVQIRTWQMHQIAEFGVAAHWKYKSGDRSKEEIDKKLGWIAKLIESEDDTRDHEEFMQALKVDIFHDEVFVFTPKGDVINLPQDSTPIDFAYAIHTAVGNRMIGAKINGMIAPIDRALQNGDIVEILTSSSSKGPSRDWLKIVKTGEARNKIRQWFKKEKRADNIIVGRGEFEREVKHYGRAYTAEQFDEICANVASRLGYHETDDLFNMVGYGGMTIGKIAAKLKDEFDRVVRVPESEQQSEMQVRTVLKPKKSSSKNGVIVDGVEGCEVKFAKCCNPLPGDRILGYITKGYGISIHKVDCPNVENLRSKDTDDSRFVTAFWNSEAFQNKNEGNMFDAYIQVFAENDIMLLANITSALADMRVTLHQINTQMKDEKFIINLIISCKNTDHFKSIMSRLSSIKNVTNVKRGFS